MSAAAGAVQAALETTGGRRLLIRPITPADGAALEEFLGGLSPQTAALRYHSPAVTLSPEAAAREARRLTQGGGGLAYVALDDEGRRPVAVAELARDQAAPDTAEGAVVVTDGYQRLGLGRAILRHLTDVAAQAQITRVRAHIQAHNAAIQRLIRSLGAPYRAHYSGGEVVYEFGG